VQDAQMPGNPGLIDTDRLDDVVNLPFAVAQGVNDKASRWISQSLKDIYVHDNVYIRMCMTQRGARRSSANRREIVDLLHGAASFPIDQDYAAIAPTIDARKCHAWSARSTPAAKTYIPCGNVVLQARRSAKEAKARSGRTPCWTGAVLERRSALPFEQPASCSNSRFQPVQDPPSMTDLHWMPPPGDA
jgi:hypothetical protein